MFPLICVVALTAADTAEVDRAEVVRQGNMVQRIGNLWQDDHQQAVVEAMGPPAGDEDKWFVSVITQRGCVPCEKLKADFSRNDTPLAAVAVQGDPDNSFAHLNFYDHGDASQKFRWEGMTITGFPTILIQPPRSGKYGDPRTIVHQSVGYDGDAAALADRLLNSIKRYVEKLASGVNAAPLDAQGPPPFSPPPKNPLPATIPGVTTPQQLVPPPASVLTPSTWPAWMVAAAAGLAVLLAVKGPSLWRWFAQRREQVEAAKLARLAAILQATQAKKADA